MTKNRIQARESIEKEQERQKRHYDSKITLVEYKENDLVLEYKSWRKTVFGDKLTEKWQGPFRIHQKLGNGAYILKTIDRTAIKN